MARPGRKELLAAAEIALKLGDKFLAISKRFENDARHIDRETQQISPYYTLEAQKQKRELRDWALEQAYEYSLTSKRYLKDAKRLTKRARWARA